MTRSNVIMHPYRCRVGGRPMTIHIRENPLFAIWGQFIQHHTSSIISNRALTDRNMSSDLVASFSRQSSTALTSPPPISDLLQDDVMAPYRHVCSLESKKFRGMLVDTFNVWLKLPELVCTEIKHVVEMLHNASLLIDDIEDSSTMRRGAPAAHRVFGMPQTLNCANHVYFVALQRLRRIPGAVCSIVDQQKEACDPRLFAIYRAKEATLSLQLCDAFTEEMIELHHGQGLDIYWRDNVVCPSLDEYEAMVLKKTGGLFRLALKVMLVLSPRMLLADSYATALDAPLLLTLVNAIGAFFQTLDDYLNVCSEVYHKNKSYCEDLTEGKFSYPVIHCIQEQQRRGGEKTLLHILKQRPTDVDVKRYCVELMKASGSLEACQLRILALKKEIAAASETIGEPEGTAVLMRCIEGLYALM